MNLQNRCLERIASNMQVCDGSDFLTVLRGGKSPEQVSYATYIEKSLAMGAAVKQLGVPEGGHVVIIIPHSLELYLAFAGCLLVGLKPSIFAHPSPKLSVTDYLSTLDELLDAANPDLVIAYPELMDALGERTDFISVTDLSLDGQGQFVDRPDDADAFLQFSSGTTGLKKCVPITFDALLWQVERYPEAIALSSKDRIISWLPVYHDMGLIACFLMPLLTGTPVVVMSPFDWVKNPVMFLKAFDDYQGTLAWVPNFCFNLLAKSTRDTDLKELRLDSIRGLINCSEPLLVESHEVFLERFKHTELLPDVIGGSYAMAENTFAVTSGGLGRPLTTGTFDQAALRLGHVSAVAPAKEAISLVSSGMPLAGVDIRIVDPESRQVLSDNQVGEISIKGPSLVSGYIHNPQATRDSFNAGWYFTGDQGFVSDSELFVLGRLDDTLVLAGHNLFPQDVESCVNDLGLTVPGRCVAFAIKDGDRGTEQLVIVAERMKADDSDEDVVNTIFSAVTANCDVSPTDVRIVAAGWLKKSTSGKLSRKANKQKYLDQREVNPTGQEPYKGAFSEEGMLTFVNSFIKRSGSRGIGQLGLDDPILSSGVVDSLSFAELLLALEDAFLVAIPPSIATDIENFDSARQIYHMIAGLETGRGGDRMRTDRLQSWHQLVSSSIIKGDAPSRYQLAPHMRDADRLQKVNKQITNRSFQLSEPGFTSDSLRIDDNGFRVCLSKTEQVSLESYMSWEGPRGAVIGNSTAFGIGSTNDSDVVHNCLNAATAGRGVLWYNFSARSATLNIQCEILREFVPRDVDYVFWMDWLDPLRTAIGQFATGISNDNSSSSNELTAAFERTWQSLIDRVNLKLDYATEKLSSGTMVVVGLSPTPAWIQRDMLEDESRLVALFDHQASQVFTKTVSPPIIAPLYSLYASELKNLAEERGFMFFDTNRVFMEHNNEALFVDRLHVTDAGQILIANALHQLLES